MKKYCIFSRSNSYLFSCLIYLLQEFILVIFKGYIRMVFEEKNNFLKGYILILLVIFLL